MEGIACSPGGEDTLIIDGRTVSSTSGKWAVAFAKPLIAITFASPDALEHAAEASPFRTSGGQRFAIAVDEVGGVHALDGARGILLHSLPPIGTPVAVAASSSSAAFAIALKERIVLWHDGVRSLIEVSATALAFGSEGLVFATKDGLFLEESPDKPLPFAKLSGDVVALVQRTGGEWLAATARGVFTRAGSLIDGDVVRLAHDRETDRVAIQRDRKTIAVYKSHSNVVDRVIRYTDRHIYGLAFASGSSLVVGLDGLRTNWIDLATNAVRATGNDTWSVVVEAPAKKPPAPAPTPGWVVVVLVIFTFVAAIAAVFLLRSKESFSVPVTYPETPMPVDAGPAITRCDTQCATDRLDALVSLCKARETAGCTAVAERARTELGKRQCEEAHRSLTGLFFYLAQGPNDVGALHDAATKALEGVASACTAQAPAAIRYQLTRVHDTVAAETIDLPDGVEGPFSLASDRKGYVYLATESADRCVLYRRVGATWSPQYTANNCAKPVVIARSPEEVYFTVGTEVMAWNGASWQSTGTFSGWVTSLAGLNAEHGDLWAIADGQIQHRHGSQWSAESTPADVHPETVFSGGAMFARARSAAGGDLLLRRDPNGAWSTVPVADDAGPLTHQFDGLWASARGDVYIVHGATLARSTDRGVTWHEEPLDSPATTVWGRSETSVFTGGPNGLFHSDGTAWRRVMSGRRVVNIAGDHDDAWVVTAAD